MHNLLAWNKQIWKISPFNEGAQNVPLGSCRFSPDFHTLKRFHHLKIELCGKTFSYLSVESVIFKSNLKTDL